MGISSIFQQLLNKPTVNPHLEVRKDAFFSDEKKQEFFLKNGWCTFESVVTPAEVESFMDTFRDITKIDGFMLDDHFLNSGCLSNPDVRKKTQNVINANTSYILPRMFNMDKVSVKTGGAYQVKPASPVSELGVHQDSTIIDETKDYCLFLWIPFCDVTEDNGPIWVLPGSHLWGNTQRSMSVPWNFAKHADTLRKYMFPVIIKKGDALVFDPALLHGSTPNLSDTVRHSITITIIRKNHQLVYFYKNKDSDTLEKYEVDESFYEDYDFASKPDETKWKKTEVKFEPFDLTQKQLISLIEKHLPR
jgi:hypothetical protein